MVSVSPYGCLPISKSHRCAGVCNRNNLRKTSTEELPIMQRRTFQTALGFALTEQNIDRAELEGVAAYKGRMLNYRR